MESRRKPHQQLVVLSDAAAVSQEAARLLAEWAAETIRAQGRLTLALAGGSTPKTVYQLLATDKYRQIISWEKVYIFWGDERCVARDHPDSNYRMAQETLLTHVPIPAGNIFPMVSQPQAPTGDADAYQDSLLGFFELSPGQLPCFDIILLGLGADGHTASLFPGTAALHEKKRLAAANYVPSLDSYRLTLTLPVLNYAARVLFLVTGESKAAALAGLVTGKGGLVASPAALVQPSGQLFILADKAAACLL